MRHKAYLAGKKVPPQYAKPFDVIQCFADRLFEPKRRKKPATIAVCFMGDMFDKGVPLDFIDDVFTTILLCPQHRFLLLTKQLDEAVEYFHEVDYDIRPTSEPDTGWPDHIWLGTSAGTQAEVDDRVPKLLLPLVAHHWLSLSPLIGPVDLEYVKDYTHPNKFMKYERIYALRGERSILGVPISQQNKLDWVVIECESGKDEVRRPCKLEWVKAIVEQCNDFGVPIHIKQLDIGGKVSRNPADWPAWAQRRDMPK